MKLPDHVLAYCHSTETVSSSFAADPSLSPGKVIESLYGQRSGKNHAELDFEASSSEELAKARSCGKWGDSQPSRLFLQAFHDALCCLDQNPLQGVVSPPLMGSYGSVPLTIIAPLVEITHHCCNLIARASHEVFLVTCSWSSSVAAKLISEALIELSNRAGSSGNRIVVKAMYGNPSPHHLVQKYHEVPSSTYEGAGVSLPAQKDIPNLDLEVLSVHHAVLGTLHAKFMVVDRQIAIVQSNNIEDNSNLEMMTHLEGPIVDSVYDYALVTWHKAFKSNLAKLHTSASQANFNTINDSSFQELFRPLDLTTPKSAQGQVSDFRYDDYEPSKPNYSNDLAAEIAYMKSVWAPEQPHNSLTLVNHRLNDIFMKKTQPTGSEFGVEDTFIPYSIHKVTCPIALVGRHPYGAFDNKDLLSPQNIAWLSCIRNARKSVFIQTPDLNASPLHEAITGAIKRGVDVTYYVCLGYNDPGELMPGQGGINESFATRLYSNLSTEERNYLHIHWFVAKDQSKPIHHKHRERSCHLKLLIVDDEVAIQGSGNQDTQSWFHSQEINIMINSEEICSSWRKAIDRNQNTREYGRGSPKDGIWRDELGRQNADSTSSLPQPLSWAQGAVGMFQKALEKGSFG